MYLESSSPRVRSIRVCRELVTIVVGVLCLTFNITKLIDTELLASMARALSPVLRQAFVLCGRFYDFRVRQ